MSDPPTGTTCVFPALVTAVLLLGLAACDGGLTEAHPNEAPETTLANTPVAGDTLVSLATMHWNGGDPDGFVERYEWRYLTKHFTGSAETTRCTVPVDSTVGSGTTIKVERPVVFEGWTEVASTAWQSTKLTRETLPFNSTEAVNMQVFQVRAVDNEGAVDETPAEKCFFTYRSLAPRPAIESPVEGESFFVLDETSDWWRGVPLTFTAEDQDGEVEEYGWAVDGGDWHWTRDTTVYVPPQAFSGALEGTHTLRVTARDNTNLVAPEVAVEIELIRPRFDRRALIIDETDESNFGRLEATDAEVDAFYRDVFVPAGASGEWDEWDYQERGMPPKEVLGRYELVVWHADDRPTSGPQAIAAEVEAIKAYLNAGGNIVMSGWRVLKSFLWQENLQTGAPVTFSEGTFVNDYMQIRAGRETSLLDDFVGATGVDGFPDVDVDSAKAVLATPTRQPALPYVNTVAERGGFTEVIGSYRPGPDTRSPQYRGEPVGLIYYGTAFDAAVLGFPLYFVEKEDAQALADEIMKRIEEGQ